MADEQKGPLAGGPAEPEPPGKSDIGNRTMQLDAYVGELQDAGADIPGDAVLAEIIAEQGAPGQPAHAPIATSLPPPLPPKKASKVMIGLGVGVVLVAIVAGVYVGSLVLGPPEPAAVAPAPAPEPAATAEEEEPTSVPITLDTVVVGAGDEEGEGAGGGGGEGEAPEGEAPPE